MKNKIVGWNMSETIQYINPNSFANVKQTLYDMIVRAYNNPQELQRILLTYGTITPTYSMLVREILTEYYPHHLPLLDKILLLS
jgi:hypothetical protein